MRGERERLSSCSRSRSTATRPVHRSVAVVLSSGRPGTRRGRHRRLGRGRIPPQLVMSAAAAGDAAVGQLLRLQQLLVLGDTQSFAVDHARPLRPRSEMHVKRTNYHGRNQILSVGMTVVWRRNPGPAGSRGRTPKSEIPES